MKTYVFLFTLLGVSTLAAATPSGSVGGDMLIGRWTDCVGTEGPSITGIIGAGLVNACITQPTEVAKNTDFFRVDTSVHGPPLVAGATVTVTMNLQTGTGGPNGCALDPGPDSLQNTGTYSNAWGFGRSQSHRFIMASDYCTGVYRITVTITPATGASVTLLDHYFNFNVISRQYTQYTYVATCDNTVTIGGIGGNLFTNCPEPSLGVDILNDGTVDEMLTVPVPDFSNVNVTFGSVNSTSNTTVFNDVQESLKAWMPLMVAMVLLLIYAIRENGIVLSISGLMFLVAAARCPLEWPVRVLFLCFGFLILLYAAMEFKDWNRERKEQKAKSSTEDTGE